MSDSDEGESRSERLRRRRGSRQQAAKADETGDPSKPSQPSEGSETDEPADTAEPSKSSVKEEQVGTYMYLPQSQKKEIERLYNVLKAEYEYEFDQEFEKNRHFFPLLIQYGLDELDSFDASDVRERLDSI